MERGRFSEDLIYRIRQESDILEWVTKYVSLKKTGQNWTGLCPFHTEKTPSFTVSPGKQVYHCFGCGAGGNVIGFLMKIDGVTFPQAVKLLAQRLGIQVDPQKNESQNEADRLREELFRIHQNASEYFHQLLLSASEAESAREYLRRRGISHRTIEEFSLGFASSDWNGLQRGLTEKGWSPEQQEKAGLIIRKEQSAQIRNPYYDRFRNRVIFPILDLQKRVIGFGGRVLDDALPKYLNSPETPIFSKGHHLYALEKARELAGKSGYLVVVEGYFDAIAAHQAGIQNVVATLGTALTEYHLQRIHRFVKSVKLIFDPDQAGIRAALRTMDLIIPSPVSGEVILLPDGEDPDSYIKKRGTEAFAGLLNQSTGLLEFAIGQGLSDSGAGSIEGKLKIVDRILPVIRKVSRPIERAYYVKQLAERLGLEERELTRELTQRGGSRSEAPGTMASRTPPKWPKEEQIVLHLLVHDRIAVDALLKEIEPSHFSDERLRRLFTLYLEAGKSGGAVIPTGLRIPPDRADSEIAPILTAFLVDEPNYDDAEQTLKDCIRTLRVKKIRVQMKTLENEIRNAEKTGDNPQVKSLLDKMVGLKKMSLEVGN